MSLKYASFRVSTDREVEEGLQYISDYAGNSDFSVLSINQVNGYWVVFYSVNTMRTREPVDRSWVTQVPVKDAHKEIPDVTNSRSKWWSIW